MPADRSLLSRMVQGSKSFSPRRPRVRSSGSSVSSLPSGSGSAVGALMSVVERAQAHVQAGLVEDLRIRRCTFGR